MIKLFLSYARDDFWKVLPYAQKLVNFLGLSVSFNFKEEHVATNESTEVFDAIRNCDFFLIFISSKSTKSETVRLEVEFAHKYEKTIIRLKLENEDVPPQWDIYLSGSQLVDCNIPDWKSRLFTILGYEALNTNVLSSTARLKQYEDDEKRLSVFLCHSSNDKPVVRKISRQLKREKWIDPWFDEEKLLPGESWELEIRKAVKVADVFIVCLSHNSVNKEGFVQKEIVYALDVANEKPEGTIFVIPLKLEPCNMPDRLSAWQWVNYYEDGAFNKLLLSLDKRARTLNIEIDD